jgi:hypothetical protein
LTVDDDKQKLRLESLRKLQFQSTKNAPRILTRQTKLLEHLKKSDD